MGLGNIAPGHRVRHQGPLGRRPGEEVNVRGGTSGCRGGVGSEAEEEQGVAAMGVCGDGSTAPGPTRNL